MNIPGRQALLLPFGRFFGRSRTALAVRGFSLAEREPTVPERQVVRHTHEEAHFVLVLAGAYVTTARQAPEVCERPMLIYNPPGTTHRDRFRSAEGRFFTLSVAAPTLRHAAECVRLPEAPTVLPAETVATARRLAREASAGDGASLLLVEGLALELLGRTGSAGAPERGAPPPWLEKARQRLADACGDEVTIAEVAAAAGVHPVHLARSFRRHFRCTPGDYLRRCRLERAAALLAQSAWTIAEVALQAGFADQSHLSRCFKRAFGETPRGYRLRLGGIRS